MSAESLPSDSSFAKSFNGKSGWSMPMSAAQRWEKSGILVTREGRQVEASPKAESIVWEMGRNCETHLRRVACLRNIGPKRRKRDRRIYLFLGQAYAIHRRYTEHPLLCVPYDSLQGVTVRPVPCNYYVIQQDVALSRRKRGFKSRRRRQTNGLGEKRLLSV